MYFSVNSYSSIGSRKGISGLMSGLETDSIVEQLTMGTRSKITKQLQNKQISEWKQEAYRESISKLTSFQKKYFSSSGSSNITRPGFFQVSTVRNDFSEYVSVNGPAASAKNIVIKSIDRLATNSQYASAQTLSTKSLNTGAIRENWSDSTVAGQNLTFNYEGTTYKLALAGNSEFKKVFADLNAADPDVNGALYGNSYGEAMNDTQAKNQVEYMINSALDTLKSKTPALSEVAFNASFADTGDGMKFSFTANGTELDVTGGTQTLFGALGYDANSDDKTAVKNADFSAMYKVKTLGGDTSVLAGSTISVSLNGVQKNITFEKNDTDGTYNTVEELKNILQNKIDRAFGGGKVSVNLNDGSGGLSAGSLSFTSNDPYSVLSITSSTNSSVLGEDGALRTKINESNRVNLTNTLAQFSNSDTALSNGLSTALTSNADGNYRIDVNGKQFVFEKTALFGDIVSTINNANAGVNIVYSETTDKYTIYATDGGSAGHLSIKNVSDLDAVDKQGRKILTEDGYLISGYDESGSAIVATDKDGNPIVGGGLTSNISLALFGADEISSDAGNLTTIGEDASLTVSFDGNPNNAVEINRTSNSFTIDGLSFDIKKTTDISTGNITFAEDTNTDELFNKIKTFIDEYNEIITVLHGKYSEKPAVDSDNRRTYLPLSEELAKDMSEDDIKQWNEKAKQGILYGDTNLSRIVSDMRRAIGDAVEDVSGTLAKFGISTGDPGTWTVESNNNGQLIIDEEKLKAALSSDLNTIINLFTKKADTSITDKATKDWSYAQAAEFSRTAGLSQRLSMVLQGSVGTFGTTGTLIRIAGMQNHTSSTENFLSDSISDINDRVSALKERLKSEESKWFAKFTALEKYLSSMNSQSEYLASLLQVK